MAICHIFTSSYNVASAACNANTIPRVKFYTNVAFLKSTDCSFPAKAHSTTGVSRKYATELHSEWLTGVLDCQCISRRKSRDRAKIPTKNAKAVTDMPSESGPCRWKQSVSSSRDLSRSDNFQQLDETYKMGPDVRKDEPASSP